MDGNPVCPGCGEDLAKRGIRLQVVRSGTAFQDTENQALFVLADDEQTIADARCAACGLKLTKNLKKMGIKLKCRG